MSSTASDATRNDSATKTTARHCAHCGFPLEAGEERGEQFCCYGCYVVHAISGTGGETGRFHLLVAQLLLGVFFSMLVMVFSLPLYSDAIYEPGESGHPLGPLAPLFRWISLFACLPVLGLLGVPVARNAWNAGLRASVDLLILAGVISAFTVSTVHVVRGQGEIYFETSSMLLVLLTAGRTLEAAAKSRAAGAFRDLLSLSPEQARRVLADEADATPDGGGETVSMVAVGELTRGDRVRVLSGERLPADGVVVSGTADVDRALVTGESDPVTARVGSRVHGGTLVMDGAIDFLVDAAVGERLLDRIVELLEDARGRRGRLDRAADRLVRWFLPFALTVAAATFVFWWPRSGPFDAFLHALATLLIACPCALGVATPLAVWTGIRQAARAGALVRSGEVLEVLARRHGMAFAFDKTGTLTIPELRVEEILPAPGWTADVVLEVGGSLGKFSQHPASMALVREARRLGVGEIEIADVSTRPGLGVEGRSGTENVVIGNPRFVRETIGKAGAAEETAAVEDEDPASRESILVARGPNLLGGARLGESLRPESRHTVDGLRALGYPVTILTGDSPRRAAAIASALDLPVAAGLLPTDKVAWVERAQSSGQTVVMVGDGINDAPVLAAAAVGIAMGSSVDLVRDTAGVVLLADPRGPCLASLLELLRVARRTLLRMRFYLGWAVGYNAIGMALAAAGLVHPLLAAGLMVVSSLFVMGAAVD